MQLRLLNLLLFVLLAGWANGSILAQQKVRNGPNYLLVFLDSSFSKGFELQKCKGVLSSALCGEGLSDKTKMQLGEKWQLESIDLGVIVGVNGGHLVVNENEVFDKMQETQFYAAFATFATSNKSDYIPIQYANTFRPFTFGATFKRTAETQKFEHRLSVFLTQQSGSQSAIHREFTSVYASSTLDTLSQPNTIADSIVNHGFDASLQLAENRLGANWIFARRPLVGGKRTQFYGGIGLMLGSLRPSVSSNFYYSQGYALRFASDSTYFETNVPALKSTMFTTGIQEDTKLKGGYSATVCIPLGFSFHVIEGFFNARYLDMAFETTPTFNYIYLPQLVSTTFSGIWFSAKLKYVFI